MKTKRVIALALVMVMLIAVLPMGTPALAGLTPSTWALPEMNAANTSGLLTPSAARDFQNALTRDEFCELVVEMVERTLGRALPVPATNPFTSDVDPISIHALKAWNYGIITGITTTLFAPTQKVERQQLCAMMIRAIRGLERDINKTFLSPGISTLPYKDASQIRDYAIEPVQLAYTNVIMQGNEQGLFMPSNDITSQECVAVIIRSYNRIEAARTPGMTADQLLDAAADRVHIGYAYGDTESGVSQDLTLPTTSTGNATVAWTSSNNNVIRPNGATGVVTTGTYPQTVTLTATIRIGNGARVKTFTLTTSQNTGDRLLLDNAQNELDILYINDGDGDGNITGRIGLPTSVLGLPVTWQSSNPSVVSIAGIVNVPSGSETYSATLTATIRLGSQTRTKTFNLSVVNPSYSRGVTLQGVQFGMTSAQVAQILGAAKRSITAGSNETWQLFYSTNYSNFIAVAFIGDRVAAVYSMAPGAASQLRSRSGAVISVAEANSTVGVNAVSYIDPGSSSQQYAIMIYDSASVIGAPRTLIADGQEQLLFELINAFRQRSGKTSLEWSAKLGSSARDHSNNSGSGNLQQRVISAGFDNACYAGGNIIPGNGDAFDALNQIVSNASGSSSMRTAILQNNITTFGAGFSGNNSGTYRTYFTYALGAVTAITGATARQDNANVATVNVSAGTGNAVTITLVIAPTGYNESVTINSSNNNIMTATNYSAANGTVTITGVANGSANITVTGNSSGKSYTIPVSVGTVYANNLALSYTPSGMSATAISSSANVAVNTNANVTGSKILVLGTGESLTIAATTTNGATVEWARVSGNAANVARNSTNNNGVVTATGTPGVITLTARVRTGSGNTWITHTITVYVVSVSPITLTPTSGVINVGGDVTANVTVSNLPTSGTGFIPIYAWSSSGDILSRTPPATETTSATFKGAKQGASAITFTATWSGASSYLGRISKQINVTAQGKPYVDSITISPGGTINLIPGQTRAVTAAIEPQTITQGFTYIWESDDPDIAEVTNSNSNNQTIKATAMGDIAYSTVIRVTVRHADGLERWVEIHVTVSAFPTITANNPGSTIDVDDGPVKLTCLVNGASPDSLPSAYRIEWTFSGTGATVGSLDDMWIFSPYEAGSGTITVNLLYTDNHGVESIVRSSSLPVTIVMSEITP